MHSVSQYRDSRFVFVGDSCILLPVENVQGLHAGTVEFYCVHLYNSFQAV